jgi:hypothetical protein
MDPELVRVFCEEHTDELNRFRAHPRAARANKETELDKKTRDHGKLVDAILKGVPAEQVVDRMNALDARRKQLLAELSSMAEAQAVRLHPSMAETYRNRVRDLVAGLTAGDGHGAPKTSEAIRALVDRIVVTPSAGDPKELAVDLEGVLAQLL